MKQVASLFFDPEDGGNKFLQNLNRLSKDYVALYVVSQEIVRFIITAV
jgi:hypothetical protein